MSLFNLFVKYIFMIFNKACCISSYNLQESITNITKYNMFYQILLKLGVN